MTGVLQPFPSGDEIHQHHDDGDYQQHMDESANGVAAHKAEQP
jgi:hypothetical protein